MKRVFWGAALSAVIVFSGCTQNAGGNVTETSAEASETASAVSDTAAETTAAAETVTETETEVSKEPSPKDASDLEFFDISAADKELLKIITDETGVPEEVLLEYARKIDNFEDTQRRYATEGIYDFNGDGVPEIYVGGWDMITPYAAVYDISGDNPEFIFSMTTKMDLHDLYDGNLELYYDRRENKYFYYAMTCRVGGDGGDRVYFIEKSRIDVDLENHILGEKQYSIEDFFTEDEWKSACEEAEKELYNYALIDTLRTLKEPYFYEEEGSYGLRLLHSYFNYFHINESRKLAMLLNETGVSGLTLHMSPDEVKELLGEPNRAFDDSVIFKAITWVYDNGNFTFIDKAEDGNYQLASMWQLNSFDFCGITENTSRSELISALKAMGIYPKPYFDFYPESDTLENTDKITAGDPKGLSIAFQMDGDRIEYMSAKFVALT